MCNEKNLKSVIEFESSLAVLLEQQVDIFFNLKMLNN